MVRTGSPAIFDRAPAALRHLHPPALPLKFPAMRISDLRTALSRNLLTALLLITVLPLWADEPADGTTKKKADDRAPEGVTLADDPATAMKKMRVTPGLKLDLFAAEPLIQNVVNFAFDEKGRAYVVETYRRRTSTFDIRAHKDWLDNDLSFRTLEDRIQFFKKTLAPTDDPAENERRAKYLKDYNGDGKIDWRDMEVESERIRLIEDTKGTGVADKATTYADGFNTLVSGVAAGILVRKDTVWFTCIPDLWSLQDTNHDGVADTRKALHHGFGVHIAYGGHDMHGLKMGPDGKIYWTIADRGTHVEENGKVVADLPDTGAVFRCDPDGSNFEVVATGLRNPQEISFDQYGNLFAGDNNADGGDKARWEYIVEGGDYGWRIGWQHLPKLGAWNSEHLWELTPTNAAAYLLPPVALISHGPAGNAYYPGTGLPERFKNHFFLADFPGGVRHFEVKPDGAGFTVDNPQNYLLDNSLDKLEGKLIWGLYPVDVDFGPDGGAYVADWVVGWEKTAKGRIFRLHDPEVDKDPLTLETKKLLAEGMEKHSFKDLGVLLGHADMRVRLAAQYELAERGFSRRKLNYGPLEIRVPGNKSLDALMEVAQKSKNQLARLHAIWGIGQIARHTSNQGLFDLMFLLKDSDPEVRAQVAKVCGDARFPRAFDLILPLILDPNPRVRFFATLAAGKYQNAQALEPIREMLKENADRDAFLRHAGVMALLWINDSKTLTTAINDPSRAIRLAALLTLRRLHREETAEFLRDSDPGIVLEAARAINDEAITNALPRLASVPLQPNTPAPLARRVMNANFRLGTQVSATILSTYAATTNAPEALRVEAIETMGDWVKPSGRDRVVGLWRPLPTRDASTITPVLKPLLAELLLYAPEKVQLATAQTLEKLAYAEAGPLLFELLSDNQAKPEVRAAALSALSALKSPRLNDALKIAKSDASETLHKAASKLEGAGGGDEAVESLAATLDKGSFGEMQAALQGLAGIKGKAADKVISKWMDNVIAGKAPREVLLDVIEAAAKRSSPSIKKKLEAYQAAKDPKDDLAAFRETLYGGDAKAGKEIFYERPEAACFRCHKMNSEGGEVGPELTGIGSRQTREYLLESIVYPNKQIAPGFESALVTMQNGTSYAGVIKSEDANELVINSPEDGILKLKKAEIKNREKGQSAMLPELANVLSRQDLRNVIEFLAQSKQK